MNKRSQFKWMILPAAAVVLPTVSLLWFMSRVVANERLVIQQKLGGIYEQKLRDLNEQVQRQANARLDAFSGAEWSSNPYGLLRRLVLDEPFQGVVIWSPDGSAAYPSAADPTDSSQPLSDPAMSQAWRLEFVEHNYASAAGQYERLAASGDPRALAGRIRCLVHQQEWGNALDAALQPGSASAAPARLLLLSAFQQEASAPGRQDAMVRLVRALEHDLFKDNDRLEAETGFLPAGQNLFIARKLIHGVESIDFPGKPQMLSQLGLLADAEERSMAAARLFPRPAGPINTLVPVQLDGAPAYVMRHPMMQGEMLLVLDSAGLASLLEGYRTGLKGTDAQVRILDGQGRLLFGEAGDGLKAIVSLSLPNGFPEGRVELFFADGNMFDKAAGRQITVYIWTGILVILLMLVVGIFAVQAVGRQIRLNKMKNDFIATVSHELRTPLASMRLLVDTLLEKRVRDEEHAAQYLRLIAKENQRLTRMIENFLTFSRMERNKNAFTMVPVVPREILQESVDAVCTKYEAKGCRLSIRTEEAVPEIPADHDAIVTVLINLLDNACKYTTEDKQIELALFTESGRVCFSVSDNGIGLSRRQIRRIFDSFYQVDSSLARVTEGCGLGLSIVRFIVNAHKGRIDVDSQPGKGSTFTVHLPVSRKNGSG